MNALAAWFDDYAVGDVIESPSRVVEADDVRAYVRFSNDVRPLLHQPSPDDPLPIPAMYLFSLGVGLLLHADHAYIPEHFVAFFGFDEIRHECDAVAGVRIRSTATVTELTPRGRNGLVHYRHETADAAGNVLVSSRQAILVKRSPDYA